MFYWWKKVQPPNWQEGSFLTKPPRIEFARVPNTNPFASQTTSAQSLMTSDWQSN
jgi:hypothetical protein